MQREFAASINHNEASEVYLKAPNPFVI